MRAFTLAGPAARKEIRTAFRVVAEPVEHDIERLAKSEISRIGRRWWRMRIGVTTKLVYVAPLQRGVKRGNDPLRRPKFSDLMMEKAMEPGLARNEGTIADAVEVAIGRVVNEWEAV